MIWEHVNRVIQINVALTDDRINGTLKKIIKYWKLIKNSLSFWNENKDINKNGSTATISESNELLKIASARGIRSN